MPTASTNQPFWLLEQSEYDNLLGHEFNSVRGGSLNLEGNSESVSLDFMWWSRRPRASQGIRGVNPPELENYENIFDQEPGTVAWWQVRPLSANPDDNGNGGIDLNPANSGNPSTNSDFYYLATSSSDDVNPFISDSNLPIYLRSSNPSLDDQIFKRLITDTYEITDVNFVDIASFNNAVAESVPESSPVVGLLLFGTISVGLLIKRKWSTF